MADFVPYDRVWETTVSTGIGAVTLAGATGGNQAFGDVMAHGEKCLACISSPTQWEVSEATYDSGANSLTRSTVLAGTDGAGSAVDFVAGTKDVQIVLPAAASTGRGGPVLQRDPELILGSALPISINGWKILKLANNKVQLVVHGDDGNNYGTNIDLDLMP